MAYRRITRLRTAGAEWQQVELLEDPPAAGWTPAYRVDTPRLLLPDQGALEVELDGRPVSADPLTGVWLTPERPYRVRQPQASQRSSVLVLAAAGAARPGPVRVGARWRLRLQLLAAAAARHDDELARDELARDEALAALVGETQTQVDGPPGPHRAVQRAQAFLAEHFAGHHTLAGIGRAAACSPFQLARQFRRATGQTLHRHRTELRLAEALRRLEAGERNLSLLAAELGFASHSHFSAVFRQLLGQRPAAMRTILTARPGG